MAHDFNKPPQANIAEDSKQRRRIPVFILIIVGIFLASLIFYMISDRDPQPGQIPADTSIPATSDKGNDQTATATAVEDTVKPSNTATASDH
jgi:hypothetical protein